MPELKTNALYYGDNLDILRKYVPDESVDLIYLDPPFNSKADYNVLFKEPTGELSAAQLQAFSDSWHWDETAERTFQEIALNGPLSVAKMISAMQDFIGRNDMMAYLVMMTVRLVDLRRVLKPTGSLYLHCDPTASHYLKLVLDTVFSPKQYRNEIVWKRTSAHGTARRYGRVHDTILFYGKSENLTWNTQSMPHGLKYLESHYRHTEPDGRRYRLSDMTGAGVTGGPSGQSWRGFDPAAMGRHWIRTPERLDDLDTQGFIYWTPGGFPQYKTYLREDGVPVQDTWTDIPPINSQAKERLGYDTQKPIALLERIIQTSSNEGGVVLDPFCGCGTAVVAAHKLGRRWIGVDITHLAITVMKKRLEDSFGLKPGRDYQVVGEPVDPAGARALARQDRYQFQWWALSLIGASPAGGDKKRGADSGVDGVIGFIEQGGVAKRAIVQVKSGHVGVTQVRDLKGTMEREKAEMGLFITLEHATAPMRTEAVSAGFYHSDLWKEAYPRIQICTIEDLLAGKLPKLPRHALGGFSKAERIKSEKGKQEAML